MAITLQNRDNNIAGLKFYGSIDLAVDASMFLWFSGYEGAIQVSINGTNVADYMIYSTVNTAEEMEAEEASYVAVESSDLTVDKNYPVLKGTSGLKITNKDTSTDTVKVAWRFLR